MASSRGKGLGAYLPEGTLVSVTDGATLGDLQEAAKEFLPPPSGLACGYRYHMYFLCGVPNITRLVKGSKEHYRECIYDEDPLVTAERYLAELRGCQKDMMAKGVLPIFFLLPKLTSIFTTKVLLLISGPLLSNTKINIRSCREISIEPLTL